MVTGCRANRVRALLVQAGKCREILLCPAKAATAEAESRRRRRALMPFAARHQRRMKGFG
jgi:hypothetical protein